MPAPDPASASNEKEKEQIEKEVLEKVEKAEEKKEKEKEKISAFQKFVNTYSTFLSSFVIGAAGLVATTIYQSKQQDIAGRQATAQIEEARTAAANQWKIERAEVLSKNLQVLASSGNDSVDQRYGVLLSLARGKIIDAELAVSYALELGNQSPDYMRTVLFNVVGKDYTQLEHNFALDCDQRFGVVRDLPTCHVEKQAARSAAIAQLIADELTAPVPHPPPPDDSSGDTVAPTAAPDHDDPTVLLADVRQVQAQLSKRAAMFDTYLETLYDKMQIEDIEKFANSSEGAHLVTAVDLADERVGEFVSADEAEELKGFHERLRKWLEEYLLGKKCDPDCKAHITEMMLTNLGEGKNSCEHALVTLEEVPDPENNKAEARLHDRLLWCRASPEAVASLRDAVLVPAGATDLKQHETTKAKNRLDDVLGLLALVPPPDGPGPAVDGWNALVDGVKQVEPALYERAFASRRREADRQRKSANATLRKMNFCAAPEIKSVAPVDVEQ